MRLILEGVDSACYCHVNGREAGYSQDSRLPAEFDVTGLVHAGENTLAVQVRAPPARFAGRSVPAHC